jgi:4-diphosphocytidyl-2-C-methyl-D-erythritol kinase
MRLRALAPGKVNLCLFVGGLRSDGRHELVTLFESVSLADELLLTTLEDGPDQVSCPGVEGPNLGAAALAALRERGWAGPPVRIEIDKRIPVAAGMGGGSADAAAVLRLAIELAPGRPEEVALVAAALGADVPSQLAPGLVLGVGAGDELEPALPLAEHALVIVPQPAMLATADVYREADRLGLPRDAAELLACREQLGAALRLGERLPGQVIVNDLEPAAVSLRPAITDALTALRDAGAEHAIVCGSGPTAFGLFWGSDSEARAAAAAESLQSAFPGASAVSPVSSDFSAPTVI